MTTTNRVGVLVVMGMTLAAGGCHSYPVRGIPVATVEPARLNAGPVAVSAVPVYTAAESEDVFYYDLLKEGYLPVLLSVRDDGPEPVELLRARLRLVTPEGREMEPVTAREVADHFGRNALAEGVFLFGPFSYADADKFNKAMERDWGDKAIHEVETVTQELPLRKYVYFKIGEAPIRGCTLTVPLDNTVSRRRDTFQIRF